MLRPAVHSRGSMLKWCAAAVVASVLVNVQLAAPQSAAAAGGVEVSPDGTTYSSTYTGTLFDGITNLVPGDTMQESFYVRNSGAEAGFLRITLRDVVAADADFADALTVSASTVGQAGIAATISQARPCWVLHEGQRVTPGQAVEISTALALGNLDGAAGQGATADFAFDVTLTSDAAPLPPTSCGQPGTTVPVVPTTRRPTSTVTPAIPGLAQTPPESGQGDGGATDLPVLNIPELLGIDPNTWRLFEEYFVLLLIGAFLAGTAWFSVVAWRRRKNEADLEPDEEGVAG